MRVRVNLTPTLKAAGPLDVSPQPLRSPESSGPWFSFCSLLALPSPTQTPDPSPPAPSRPRPSSSFPKPPSDCPSSRPRSQILRVPGPARTLCLQPTRFPLLGFHEREGRPYCRRDFLQLFAPRCQGCQGPILDNYISALSALWHPDCFVCRVRAAGRGVGGAGQGCRAVGRGLGGAGHWRCC